MMVEQSKLVCEMCARLVIDDLQPPDAVSQELEAWVRGCAHDGEYRSIVNAENRTVVVL